MQAAVFKVARVADKERLIKACRRASGGPEEEVDWVARSNALDPLMGHAGMGQHTAEVLVKSVSRIAVLI